MMLEHLGHSDAHDSILRAIEDVLGSGGPRTRDIGGTASTVEVGRAIEKAIESK
jgi:tartrate dehydrogenase/decarboxylase / D-malate dehydrogenase